VQTSAQMSSRRLGPLAVAIFLAARVATLGAGWVLAHQEQHGALNVLTKAEPVHYLRLAAHGYDAPPPIGPGGA